MTLMDPIGDMFTRIRNGQMRLRTSVDVPSSNFRLKILEVLKNEGYITNFFIEKLDNNKKNLKVVDYQIDSIEFKEFFKTKNIYVICLIISLIAYVFLTFFQQLWIREKTVYDLSH